MRVNISVEVDFRGLYKKTEQAERRIRYAVTEQVVKDSNFFAPQDTGALMRSALMASNYETGQAIWDVPYASKLYWNPQFNFSRDVNPNAGGLWFETAKSMALADWINIAKGEVK